MKELTYRDFLDRIVGQPIRYIGRACNLLWIGIGDKIEVTERNVELIEKAVFSLHIQSAWRIVNSGRKEILLAISDFYSPREGMEYDENFNWDVQGNNLFDEKAAKYLAGPEVVYVMEYRINRLGDLLLLLSNGDQLEVYVDASDDAECWRIFRTNKDEPHLVITGEGIEM